MTDNGQHSPLHRAVEALVYAPVGMALFAKDVLPPLFQQFVARGKAELGNVSERVSGQVSQAKVIGKFAVNQGGEQIKREVSQRLDEVRAKGEDVARLAGVGVGTPATPPTRHAPPADEGQVGAPPAGGTAQVRLADASHLPIPDYDELSASQVVARLAGLEPEQLAAVAEYERSGRQRKTILTRIDQLTA